MERSDILSLSVRYGVLLLVGITNLLLGEEGLFYSLFTPLTLYPSFHFFVRLYEGVVLIGSDTIFIKGFYAVIAPACVAGSAYFLLLILNLTTPMRLSKRIVCLVYLFALFLILNIGRIILFGVLWTRGYDYFDFTHIATWYFGSTLLVAGIWFSAILLFKIREAPVLSDVGMLIKDIRAKNRSLSSLYHV